jgi:hypothetical protein
MYARDDLDSRKMHNGLQSTIAAMKRKGTLPPRRTPAVRAAADLLT